MSRSRHGHGAITCAARQIPKFKMLIVARSKLAFGFEVIDSVLDNLA